MRSKGVSYFACFVAALAITVTWSLVGCAIAWSQSQFWSFLDEWRDTQGFFLVGIGSWLLLISRSGALDEQIRRILKPDQTLPRGVHHRMLRIFIVSIVSVVGTASLIGMGFRGNGPVLAFLWFTCGVICCLAGLITLHTLDLLLKISGLQHVQINIFHYAPARTPELRYLINYFTTFTFILSVGYFFAFLGTWKADWTATKLYIQVVQLFWPVFYVPICSVALFYPHFVIHKLIQNAKEQTLDSYQREIDILLAKYQNLKSDDIQRANTLAQLFDRIAATPDYVVDFGIAFRVAVPYLINLAIFLAKPALGFS